MRNRPPPVEGRFHEGSEGRRSSTEGDVGEDRDVEVGGGVSDAGAEVFRLQAEGLPAKTGRLLDKGDVYRFLNLRTTLGRSITRGRSIPASTRRSCRAIFGIGCMPSGRFVALRTFFLSCPRFLWPPSFRSHLGQMGVQRHRGQLTGRRAECRMRHPQGHGCRGGGHHGEGPVRATRPRGAGTSCCGRVAWPWRTSAAPRQEGQPREPPRQGTRLRTRASNGKRDHRGLGRAGSCRWR
jgi:hypothetical protein